MNETAIEIARREADEAEAEEDAANEDVEIAEENEPDAPPPIGEAEMAKMEREESRHRQAVQKIMGDAFDAFIDCPLCTIFPAGFVPTAAQVPDELAAQLGQAVFAYFDGPELVTAPYLESRKLRRCADCDGWGSVLSGARNALHRVEMCMECTGNGFVPVTDAAPQPPTVASPSLAGNGLEPMPAPYFDIAGVPTAVPPDEFGQPWGHPSYGRRQEVAAAAEAAAS